MRGRHLGCMLAALAVALAAAAPAAAERLPVRHYTLADGLPHNSITALYQDHRGYLWVGTAEGLARFDGYRFTTYGVDRGLGHPYVTAITEDSSGRLWVATYGGVSLLKDQWAAPSTAIFINYLVGGKARNVNGLHAGADGVLWCATYDGLFRARVDAGDATTFQIVTPYEDRDLLDVVTDSRGRTWVWGLDVGLERVGADRPTGVAITGSSGRGWFLRGRENRVWLTSPAGVFELGTNPGNDSAPWRPVPMGTRGALAGAAGPRGAFWITTPQGLLRAQEDGRRSLYSTPHGLSSRLNRVLLVDREGHVWVGSETDGLYLVIDGPIVSYTAADGLPGHAVDSVIEGPDGRIYALVRNAGMAEINSGGVTVLPGSSRLGQERWPRSPRITAAGDWWVVRREGLCRVAGPVPDFRRPAACIRGEDPGDAGFVMATDSMDLPEVYEDRDGRLWYASRTTLHRFDPVSGRTESTPVPFSRPSLGVMPGVADGNGDVWFLSAEDVGRWRNGRLDLLEPGEGLPEIRPRSLLLDRKGRLWIGMRSTGVAMTDNPSAARPTFVSYTTQNGLSSNSVWSIAEDDAGRIYLGTGRGLDRLDPATGHVRRFTTADGLAGDLVNRCIRDRRGYIWIATPTGLSRLDPRAESEPATAPPTLLVRVAVSGEDLGLPERGLDQVSGLRLPSSSNTVVVEYGAVSFEGALRYQHRLEGIDAAWSAPTDQRSVTYARMAPGAYTVAVRAVTGDGDAGAPARLAFRILPPFWRQAWFVGVVLFGAAGVGLAFHRLRVRRLVAMDRIRREIARDLHDDVGAGLVQVAILSEVAKRADPASHATHLDEIATLARTMRDAMSDIVWSIDPRASGFAELVRRMQEAATVLAGDGVHVEFRTPPAETLDRVTLPPDRGRHLLLVLKEAVANVARHAQASRLTIDFQLEGREVVLRIEDDGLGFDTRREADGHGLRNLERRAAALEGRLTINSTPGRGTVVELRVPL